MREKIYRESMNFKVLSEGQLENIFPEWKELLNRIDNYRRWLEKVDLDRNSLVEEQYNLMYENVYSILGGRGSGKTSAIFTLRNFIKKAHPADKVLPIVMPEVIPEEGETLGWILASLESVVKQLSEDIKAKKQRDRNIFYDCKNEDTLIDIYNEVKELCYSRSMKTGGESFSEEVRKSERKSQSGYELSRKISEFWLKLVDTIKKIESESLNGDEPLIYLIFDDVDLNPEKALEICSIIIKYLSHPNLIILMTADEELFYDVILDAMIYKMKNLQQCFQTENLFTEPALNGEEYYKKLRDTASLYMGKIMPVSSRYMLKTFEECNQKKVFLLEDSGSRKQDMEYFFKKLVNNLIKNMSDGIEELEQASNFLYYNNNFISVYLIFLGNTSRQIIDAQLVIKKFFDDLCLMNNKLKNDQIRRHQGEDLKEKIKKFITDILCTRGIYWGNSDEIVQMSENLIISKQGTADIYIDYMYLQQLFRSKLEEVQGNRTKEKDIIKKYISLFILMFFTENILLLINPLLRKLGVHGRRRRIHGYQQLVKVLDSEEESLICCEEESGNLSEFLYIYQNVLENYFSLVPFDKYNIADIRSYLYMINDNMQITVRRLEKYYWNNPKWFGTIIPMIWFVYKKTFLIDKKFYMENVKSLFKIPIYGQSIHNFEVEIDEEICNTICRNEKLRVGDKGNITKYQKNLSIQREKIFNLYMKVEEYEILDIESVKESFSTIKSLSTDSRIRMFASYMEVVVEAITDDLENHFLVKEEMNSFFKYIEKKDKEMQKTSYEDEWGEDNKWNIILSEVNNIKMNLDIPSYNMINDNIIKLQREYLEDLKLLTEEYLNSKEYYVETYIIPYKNLYRTIREIYTGKVKEGSLFSEELKRIIREDTENYIEYIK